MIRMGEITYANAVPIFSALRKIGPAGRYEFIKDEPSALNRMLYQGEVDLSPSSSFEYGLHSEEYYLMPDLSISSDGEVKSVLLISKVPIEELYGRTVLLSSASATSNALIQILLEKQYGHECAYVLEKAQGVEPACSVDARVSIGNPALRSYLHRDEGGYLYDLSVLWKDLTGLPFVFALWIMRRDFAAKDPEEVSRLVRDLFRARKYAEAHFQEIAEEFQAVLEIESRHLVQYWRGMSYDLSEEKIVSLKRYFDYAHELGLMPKRPPIQFFLGA